MLGSVKVVRKGFERDVYVQVIWQQGSCTGHERFNLVVSAGHIHSKTFNKYVRAEITAKSTIDGMDHFVMHYKRPRIRSVIAIQVRYTDLRGSEPAMTQ